MKKLVFVYNANSGTANAYLDALHKIFEPATYSCDLCALTHGSFSEKAQWKKFRKGLNVETEFLHKDEFRKHYASKFGYKFEFPVVLMEGAGGLGVFLKKEEISKYRNTEEFIKAVQTRLYRD